VYVIAAVASIQTEGDVRNSMTPKMLRNAWKFEKSRKMIRLLRGKAQNDVWRNERCWGNDEAIRGTIMGDITATKNPLGLSSYAQSIALLVLGILLTHTASVSRHPEDMFASLFICCRREKVVAHGAPA